jgi:hypothetical protein
VAAKLKDVDSILEEYPGFKFSPSLGVPCVEEK